jgi:hypothetical protein
MLTVGSKLCIKQHFFTTFGNIRTRSGTIEHKCESEISRCYTFVLYPII